jgi:hypothetical protein
MRSSADAHPREPSIAGVSERQHHHGISRHRNDHRNAGLQYVETSLGRSHFHTSVYLTKVVRFDFLTVAKCSLYRPLDLWSNTMIYLVVRRQIVEHVPMHSELVRREAERFGYRYIDMVGDFQARLHEADAVLTGGVD